MSRRGKSSRQQLASVLCGQSAPIPDEMSSLAEDAQLIQEIEYHGVAGLLAEKPSDLVLWPERVKTAISQLSRERAKWELRHKAVICDVLTELREREVPALLLKGTALAYDVYKAAWSRFRGDTDLLVPEAKLGSAREVLTSRGFLRAMSHGAGSGHSSYQEVWSKTLADGSTHEIDLHWQVMNSPVLRPIFHVTDCLHDRVPIPHLCSAAFRMSDVRALMHACLHLAMHIVSPYYIGAKKYHGGDRLIWLVDIDLLAKGFEEETWEAFADLCNRTGVTTACLSALMDAHRLLGTPVAMSLLRASIDAHEPRSDYLINSNRRKRAIQDLQSIETLSDRFDYIFGRVFPPAQFMRGKYPTKKSWPLVFLYVLRATAWLSRGGRKQRS